MKKLASLLLCVILLATAIPGFAAEEEPLRKVIFDTDMLYLSDDAVAMFMLAAADSRKELELLGVTTVGANCYTAQASCAALRQLELIGRSDIPVYQGTDVPLGGFRDMETEARLYGVPYYCGAYWSFETNWFVNPYARPTDYLNLEYEPMFGYPETRLQEQTAWDFMIEQVHKYPGEVTIMAVGAATNVAIAIQKDPTLVRDAAGIIYMGGDIDVPGNASAAAEMNWFYDPDAIKLCLAADWKSQLVVPDDLAQQIYMDTAIYARLHQMEVNRITELVFVNEDNYDPSYTHYVWDVVVPAVFLRPEIMTDLQTRYLTVDDQRGLNYGRAVSWPQHNNNDLETGRGMPEGVKPVQILMKIDEDAFWDFYAEMLTGKLD